MHLAGLPPLTPLPPPLTPVPPVTLWPLLGHWFEARYSFGSDTDRVHLQSSGKAEQKLISKPCAAILRSCQLMYCMYISYNIIYIYIGYYTGVLYFVPSYRLNEIRHVTIAQIN